VYNLPEAGRTDKGVSIMNVLALNPGERITAAVPVPDFDMAEYCTMATEKGRIKRVMLSDFESVRPSGLIAMALKKDDRLGWVRLTSGNDEVMMVTASGRALRMDEKEIRCMGRPAGGVTGIRMAAKDIVTAMDVLEPEGTLLVITENGFGKRTPLNQYVPKSRGSKGVSTIDKHSIDKIGLISTARIVQDDDEITLISSNGVMIRMNVKDISIMGRATRGVHVMDIHEGQSVASMARIQASLLVGEGNDDEKPVTHSAPVLIAEAAVIDEVEDEFEDETEAFEDDIEDEENEE
jgi:DNA gyrase subunit A